MSMTYELKQTSDATICKLLDSPTLIMSFISNQPPRAKSSGFLARWFGSGKSKNEEPSEYGSIHEEGLSSSSLEKAWHGLHFLFTGTAWEGEKPANFLVAGGTEVGAVDVGYGPARAYTSGEVASIAAFLETIDEMKLRSRFNGDRMMELEIYPTIWDRSQEEDDTQGYLLEYFAELVSFVNATCTRRYGMVTYLG
ncbi:MAG: YfbM family protein [Gemmatales bacterium]